MEMEKEIKRLRASGDYWKEKAEKLIKENKYYKKKAREFELALKIEYSDRPDLYKDLFGQVGEFGSGKTLNRMLRGS